VEKKLKDKVENPERGNGYEYNCEGSEGSEQYWDNVMPDHVKELIAERRRQREAAESKA